jgi:predicted Zn-dependent protease
VSAPAGAAGVLAGLPPAPDVVEEALRRAGGAGCIVLVEDSTEVEIRYAVNTTTTNGVRGDRRVTVISLSEVEGGIAVGVARRGGAVDVADLVRAAEADAASSPPADDAAALLDGGEMPGFGDAPGTTELSVLEGVVADLGAAFRRARDHDRVLAGFAEHGVATEYLGTSTGIRRRHEQPTGALHLVARSTDGVRSAWAGAGTADFTDVSVAALEDRLATRLGWAERRSDLPAGRYEVLLPPEAVADLMVDIAEYASGRDAEDGRSVFSKPGGGTRVGERLSPLPFGLRSDPEEPGLECAPFLSVASSSADVSVFDNGLPLAPTALIEGGQLARLYYHRAGAARSGTAVTAPIDNLVLQLPGATASLDEMVATTERGLLLTCLWYIREVDPATLLLTGLTRDGVYLVEDGRVTGAVNNFRFNESPVDLLGRVTEAGATVRTLGREFGEWVNRTAMPTLRIPDFNMSSVSQAS